jgi:hypothetical protein
MILNEKENIISLLKQPYFWDVDFGSGNIVSKRLVIERTLSLGTLADMALLLRYYGPEEVEKTMLSLNYIDQKTLNFASKYFGKSKRTFKCYTRKQLMPRHWDY